MNANENNHAHFHHLPFDIVLNVFEYMETAVLSDLFRRFPQDTVGKAAQHVLHRRTRALLRSSIAAAETSRYLFASGILRRIAALPPEWTRQHLSQFRTVVMYYHLKCPIHILPRAYTGTILEFIASTPYRFKTYSVWEGQWLAMAFDFLREAGPFLRENGIDQRPSPSPSSSHPHPHHPHPNGE